MWVLQIRCRKKSGETSRIKVENNSWTPAEFSILPGKKMNTLDKMRFEID